jgi:hypothetical protein
MTIRAILAAALLTAALPAAAFAETVAYKAELTGSHEVPANDSKATGAAALTYDPASKLLTWKVTYSGLTGPAIGAHIHGPADPGTNAPVAIKFGKPDSPIDGSITLTDAQAADLKDGKFYINVHTAEHKGGEIRGQVVPAQ